MSREILVILGWLGGLTISLFLLWALWWALFGDRSRGTRRCPRCWHVSDPGTSAEPNLRCQECGHLSTSERDLLRTRRKWLLATLCVVGLVAETIWVQTAISDSGWWGLLPDRLLIAMDPWLGDRATARQVRASLRDRLVCGRVDPSDAVRLFTLAREGAPDARPGSARWRERYLPWIQALHGPGFWNAYAGQAAVREAAVSVPPDIQALVPTSWWPGTPMPITLFVEDGLPEEMSMRLEVLDATGLDLTADALAALRAQRWTRRGPSGFGTELPLTLGAVSEGPRDGELRLQWSVIASTADRPVATGEVRVPIRTTVRVELPPLTPRNDPAAEEAVRAAFEPGLLRRRAGLRPRFAFSYRPPETAASEFRDTAFGLVVEACESGTPRRTLRVWWRGGSLRSMGWERPIEDRERLLEAEPSAVWTLRVRGDELLARRAAEPDSAEPATRWWSGMIELPLRIEDVGPDHRMQRWVLEPSPAASEEAARTR